MPSRHCEYAGGWRIASIEQSSDSEWRAWKAIEPAVGVRRPVDPAIPFVEVIADRVLAIGYCAPARGPERPDGGATMVAWRIVEGEAERLAMRELGPGMPTILGALFQPPGASGSWPDGRYVFRVGNQWLGAEVRQPALRVDASPSVSPSPALPSPSVSREGGALMGDPPARGMRRAPGNAYWVPSTAAASTSLVAAGPTWRRR